MEAQKVSAQDMYHKYMSTGAAKYLAKKTVVPKASDDVESPEAPKEQRYKWRARETGEKLRPEDVSVSSEECFIRSRKVTYTVDD